MLVQNTFPRLETWCSCDVVLCPSQALVFLNSRRLCFLYALQHTCFMRDDIRTFVSKCSGSSSSRFLSRFIKSSFLSNNTFCDVIRQEVVQVRHRAIVEVFVVDRWDVLRDEWATSLFAEEGRSLESMKVSMALESVIFFTKKWPYEGAITEFMDVVCTSVHRIHGCSLDSSS